MKQTICSVGDAILLENFPKDYSNKKIKDKLPYGLSVKEQIQERSKNNL